MPVLQQLIKVLKASTIKVSWTFLFLLAMAHMATSWLMMGLAGEEVAHSVSLWLYFYVVTASTVGYGDFSPNSTAGQLVATFYLIPGGISLFAALIGKATVTIGHFWRQQMQGNGDYSDLTGHTVVLGWHGATTEKIVDILKADRQLPDDIVLCVTKDINNPRPGDLKFVKGDSFANAELLKRAGVASASRIIIYDDSDERVTTVALSTYHLKAPDCHLVAHCENPNTAAMLRRTLPGIECTEALALEMLVRSATDAGISRVVNELLAVNHGATQYQTRLKDLPKGCTFGQLFNLAKEAHNATLLGVTSANNEANMLNPPSTRELSNGDVLYYMAYERLTSTHFSSLLT